MIVQAWPLRESHTVQLWYLTRSFNLDQGRVFERWPEQYLCASIDDEPVDDCGRELSSATVKTSVLQDYAG